MKNVVGISARLLYDAVYEACYKANIYLPLEVYAKLKELEKDSIESSSKMSKIFANCAIAAENKRPLCQDTGQIIVFLKVGNNVVFNDENPNLTINKAIEDCYRDNYFRKSVVKDAFFNRTNTNTNTPAIIYTDFVDGDEVEINILVKGGGAENMSKVEMLTPAASEADIIECVANVIKASGQNACPPILAGIGIGGTLDYASVLSKKSFFVRQPNQLAEKIKNYINETSNTKVADIKILSSQTHIACLPVCVTINCHSTRHASVLLNSKGHKILTEFAIPNEKKIDSPNYTKINTDEFDKLKALKPGTEVLLSGEIYTARDMAHKRLVEMIENKEELPFELKNTIIFYAGPCPKTATEIIGPIGPTTSKRMDKFAPILYDNGVLATIGKGERNEEVKSSIEKNNALYFSAQGGVASLFQNCVKSAETIAFAELGAEAVYKLQIENLPIKLELK